MTEPLLKDIYILSLNQLQIKSIWKKHLHLYCNYLDFFYNDCHNNHQYTALTLKYRAHK